MATPLFTFRMPRKDREALDIMAKIYGAPSSGAFCAEMVGVMCSGDTERVKAFVGRLIARAGEQMALEFGKMVDGAMPKAEGGSLGERVSEPSTPKAEAKPKRKRKGARKRARIT
jgi:hypothetical protein